MAVSIDREIDFLQKIPGFGRYLAQAFRKLSSGLTNLGTNLAADATQTLPPPSAPQSVTVKSNGNGLVHAVINDQNELRRGIHYFMEYSTEPSFLQPHVVHLGTSRSMNPIQLPAMDDDGNPQKFYFRAYSQLPGSQPSKHIKFGGDTAAPVDPGGSQQMTLVPSTGSGTAPANGQAAGQGFGRDLHRPASVNIRTVKGA